jgi:hypothetical protein
MALADAAVGTNNAIVQILARKVEAQRYADQVKQQVFDNLRREKADALAAREQDQRERYQQETLRQLADQRDASADLHRQGVADRIENGRMIGDVLETPEAGALRTAGRSSDIRHDTATLPSTQYGGVTTLPQESGASMPTATPMRGFLRTTSNAGNPEQDVY